MPKSKKLQEYTQPAGSPQSGGPLFLAVGRLIRPHGVHGEMLMEVITDFPERIKRGVQVYVGDEHFPVTISSRRGHASGFIIAFEEYDTPESAAELNSHYLYVSADDRPPLPKGDFYHHQLLGLKVITDEGRELGTLDSILETGANDVYLVHSESGKEALLPNIASVVKEIDLEKGEMLIHLLPGLIPD